MGTMAEIRSTTLMPASSRASTFAGLLVMRRTECVELLEDLGGKLVLTAIGFAAEFEVGLDRVHSLVLVARRRGVWP